MFALVSDYALSGNRRKKADAQTQLEEIIGNLKEGTENAIDFAGVLWWCVFVSGGPMLS